MFNTVYSALYYNFAHLDRYSKRRYTITNPDDMLDPNSILILHGGEDISPSLYGAKPNRFCGADDNPSVRDSLERDLFLRAKELGIPILGICRGAQLACALNDGGSLVQHVTNHGGRAHDIQLSNGKKISTNSYHHQMMVPWKTNHELLGWAASSLSSVYYGEDNEPIEMPKEPEIVWFPESKALAVQGHPEWLDIDHPLVQYVINTLKEKT